MRTLISIHTCLIINHSPLMMTYSRDSNIFKETANKI